MQTAESSVARRVVRAAGRAAAMNLSRAVASLGIVSTLACVTGCYSYVPVATAEVAPPASVSANINDTGRIALGDRIGAEVAAVDGKVVERSDSALRLMVSDVRFLNGMSNQWQGQEVQLRFADVKSLSRRTFSRSRTALMIGAIAGGLALSIAGLNFLGLTSGDPSNDKGGGGQPPDTFRGIN